MKRIKAIGLALLLAAFCTLIPTSHTQAQVEAVLEAIKRAIIAADIAVQKVQNATIDLQNVQKQVENELSKLKLNEIADWTRQQKDLYQDYFDELRKVKTVIVYYKRVTEVIDKQEQLVAEYRQAYALVQKDSHFTTAEIKYIYSVYSGIVDESVKNLDQILGILESFTMSMSDAQRLKIINNSADGIEQNLSDLRNFNNQNVQLSIQRSKDIQEMEGVRKLYGL